VSARDAFAQFGLSAQCAVAGHRFPHVAPGVRDAQPDASCSRCGRDEAAWPGSWNHRVYRALRSQVTTTDRYGVTSEGAPVVVVLVLILVGGVALGVHLGVWQVPLWTAAAVLAVFAVEVLSQPNRRRTMRDSAERAERARQFAAREAQRYALAEVAESRARSAGRSRLLISRPARTRRAR
jgi:hypothetical protein